ncbi:Serine/threonine-protein kinase ATR at C-terminar half [Coccomyxa sp. Obi]|nr:Serine/threonine-protein kinase ATR at C-terminar half [Coccomyxa sp. Obi]
MASDRLSALLNDLSDCLMAASDSSSSPHGSELQLSTRMRTVLVSLLGECIDVKTVKEKDLKVLLNLVNLALQRIPKMVRDDRGATVLIIFSQILPLLAEERLTNLHGYLLNTVTSLTGTLQSANHAAYRQLCMGTGELVTDLRDLLRFMCQPGALPPGVSATVQCFSGVHVGPAPSTQRAEQKQASQRSGQQSDGAAHTSAAATITLSSISQCKTFLCNALELFARIMTETPATFAAVVPAEAILAIADLLAHAGFSVQVAAAQAAAQLLTTIPAERLPLSTILESTVVALKAWAGPCACFADHALFLQWSQHILAVLELLIGVSRDLGVSKVAFLKISTVVTDVILKCPKGLLFRCQLCQLMMEIMEDHPELACNALPLLPMLALGDELAASLCEGLRCMLEQFGSQDLEMMYKASSQTISMVDQEPGVAVAPEGRLTKRRRVSDRGHAAAGVAQGATPSQQPTQPVTSWEAEQAHGKLAASGPQKDSVTNLVAELAALAATVSPSSSGTLSSRERLQLLSCLFYILGWGCASLRQVLTQALQAWLASEPVPAATPNHPGMDEQMLMLVALDAHFASQTACLLGSSPSSTSEEVRAVWQRAPLTKETAKGIIAWPWNATGVNMRPEHLQQAKLAAIRVQLAFLAYHLIEGDRSLPFAKGTALARALEDADATVRAGAACLMPAFMALSTRSQAKVVSAAFSAFDTLKGDPSKAVRFEAAKAVRSLVQMQALHRQPFTILSLACLSAEGYWQKGCGPAHWQCLAGGGEEQYPKEDQHIDVLLGLEHVQSLASTLVLREPEEDVQVEGMLSVLSWLEHAKQPSLSGCRAMVSEVLTCCSHRMAGLRAALVARSSVFTRQDVLLETFAGLDGNSDADAKKQLRSAELRLLQEIKKQLEETDDSSCRESLLHFITAFSAHMSPAGLEADMRHILVLVLLVGRLDDPDPTLRVAAAELLIDKAAASKVSVRELIFGAPRLLEWIGWNIVKRDHLLGEVAELLDMSEHDVVECMLKHALPPLVEAGNKSALEVLAGKIGSEPQNLLQNYGHTIIAKCLYEGADDFDSFVVFVESIVGKGFISLLDALMQKVIIDILHRAGDSSEWASGYTLPGPILQRATDALVNLSDIQSKSDAANFLAASDHVTRILKEYGDTLDRYHVSPEKADISRELRVLRCVLLLIELTGKYVGHHLPPIIVLLTSSVKASNAPPLKLQALEGWRALVKVLAKHSPSQLSDVANQIVVALLEPLQEGGALTAAAAKAMEELVVKGRPLLQSKLQGLPPLPQSVPGLEKVAEVLKQERGALTIEEQELRPYLHSHRAWLSGLWAASGGGASLEGRKEQALLLSQLLGSLLKICDPEAQSVSGKKAQQACADCLGLLGAVDPARITLDLAPPPSLKHSQHDLLVTLLTQHLVRVLRVASSLQVLDAASVAIQELFSHYGNEDGGPGESNSLFLALPKETQALVRPYLDSKFSLLSTPVPPGVIFGTARGNTFQKWMYNWPRQLTIYHATGELVPMFKACNLVCKHDVATTRFLLPYIVHNALAHGSNAARDSVRAEMEAVLRTGHASREGELCVQEVFSLLDALKKAVAEARTTATATASVGGSSASARSRSVESGISAEASLPSKRVALLLESIQVELQARAAFQCGAHARALLYFETHVRTKENGALNPAALRSASYNDEDVSFFQEMYGKLEEPDGLSGLVRLRSGGPRLEDQVLAAEKAGCWSAALTLYEQALKNEADSATAAADGRPQRAGHGGRPGPEGQRLCGSLQKGHLSVAQRGHLNCLLQLGHLQALLAEVDGWASRCTDAERPHLASCGVAAAWRLGRWQLLESYLEQTRPFMGMLHGDDQWEVRLGELLSAFHHRDNEAVRQQLAEAAGEVMGRLSAASMESYSRAYPHLVRLHMLQEASDAAQLAARGSLGPIERQRILRWDERLRITQSSLATQEPILALRRQLAVLAGDVDEAGKCWLQHAQLCRISGHNEAAGTATLEALAHNVTGAALERARLLWDRDQQHDAILKLKEVIQQMDVGPGGRSSQLSAAVKQNGAELVLQLACWTAATGQGIRADITGLFEQAVGLDTRAEEGYFAFAKFLDQHMRDARDRQERIKEARKRAAEDAARARAAAAAAGQDYHVDPNPNVDRLNNKARIELGEDKPFIELLPELLRNYGHAVEHGNRNIYQALPRMLTIWFEYGDYCCANISPANTKERTARTEVINIMSGNIKTLPLYVWLVALPQLISRICHPHLDTQKMIQHLLTRVTGAYPHQTLWALASVSKSTVYARQEAAASILNSAKRHEASKATQRLFHQFGEVSDQFIRLCNHPGPDKRAKSMSARKEFSALMRMMPLDVMVPTTGGLTLTLPTSGLTEKSHNPFGQVITIAGIKDEVVIMSSLQRPKKITLIGSDGRQYTFLAKPKDDLRKDHRMMEVAGVINRLFAREPSSRRRNLYLRRFAVVPLSEDCGFIEWVPQTVTLRNICNEVYAAEGITDMRSTLASVNTIHKNHIAAPNRRSEWLNKVLQMFPPRLHRWLLSKWSEPAAWHNARLAFTRTNAVWSMVGHIVGLGDRHGENILVDASSGDVVHVDFSCLFDRGLLLEVPEMVPFRLTQNLIDGFGVSGYEGVFRKSCEITLQVLREHRDTLVSVMETFVHDPLCEWTQRKHQRSSAEEMDNPQAKDALATLEGRLTGTLMGVTCIPSLPLSAEGQAHRLITEATDKENLGSMYIWWMPWF